MKILHVFLTKLPIPPQKYGGTERVIWSLSTAQREVGHEVRFMLKKNTGNLDGVYIYDENKAIKDQIDDWADVVHFHWAYDGELSKPFICTEHGHWGDDFTFSRNTVFLSKKHAETYGASCYVNNGLNWLEYGEPNLTAPQPYFHYLAKAAWDVKNIQGAVQVAKLANVKLQVMGGRRVNLKRNKYAFLSPSVKFHGMVGGQRKLDVIRSSSGLIFPVLWDEPFGLAVIESLYMGTPVFATPYGAIPEIVNQENIGYLSKSYEDMADTIKNIHQFDRAACHDHAKTYYNHHVMAKNYQLCYERVMDGEYLNKTHPKCDAPIKVFL